MRCRGYLVLQAYVPLRVSMPRVLHVIRKIRGSRIVSVNEESRRIVASIPGSGMEEVVGLCMDSLEGCMVEVKYSCRALCLKKLASQGFHLSGSIGYGVVNGRIVEVEESRAGIRVKIGRRTRSARVRPPVVPSMFLLEPGEAVDALRDSQGILGWLGEACNG
ncbi:MAG: hypothetical protein F7C08_00260 [Desulfurococcales archaeon]|nr:hypothetical protein [Desulfurococcales archaeon]MCE4604961.1 hypothetical protein [Desulfurococcales archaeon]